MEKITFCPEDGEAVEFFVLEQTRLGGVDYILVTDSEDDDAEALILKDVYTDIRGNETNDEKNGRYRFTSAQFIAAEP